jgi:hypothetical protein
MSQYSIGAHARRRNPASAFWRAVRRGTGIAAVVVALTAGLVACAGGGTAAGGSGSTFAPEGTTTGDHGGSVEVNVEVGECVAVGGSGDFASASRADCGSMEATYKVVGKAPESEQCIADADAAYSESILGVAEAGALCLDIDWVQGHCFDLPVDGDAKRVDCATPGPNVVRAGARIEDTSDDTVCGEHGALVYPVRKVVVCVEQVG